MATYLTVKTKVPPPQHTRPLSKTKRTRYPDTRIPRHKDTPTQELYHNSNKVMQHVPLACFPVSSVRLRRLPKTLQGGSRSRGGCLRAKSMANRRRGSRWDWTSPATILHTPPAATAGRPAGENKKGHNKRKRKKWEKIYIKKIK